MSKESVVVLGSSGYVGTATIKTLAAKYTDKVNVRAGVRNPDTDKAKSLAADNVQVIKADLGDPASLDSAINDGDVVFGAFCTNVLPSSFLMAFLPLFFFRSIFNSLLTARRILILVPCSACSCDARAH